jgi:hypothetical protein
MANPTVAGFEDFSYSTPANEHILPIPSGTVAGDILVYFVGRSGSTALTVETTYSGSAWTLATVTNSPYLHLVWKIADGSDALKLKFNGTTTLELYGQAYRIAGGDTVYSAQASSGATTSSANANPPNVAPSIGAKDFLAIVGCQFGSGVTPSAAPSSYTDLTSTTGFGTAASSPSRISSARRNLTAATSEDPAAFTSSSTRWRVFTVLISPSDTRTGTGNVTQDAQTGSAAGSVSITGAGSATAQGDTASASGTVSITGAGDATQSNDTGAATGTASSGTVTGEGTATQDDQTGVAAGAVTVTGAGSATLDSDTGAAAGVVTVSGVGAATQGADTGSAAGVVAITGAGTAAQADHAAAASGAVSITGAGAAQSEGDTGQAEGLVIAPDTITGAGEATQDSQTGAAAGTVSITGASASTQVSDAGQASGAVSVTGAGAATQDGDTGEATGTVTTLAVITGAGAVTQDDQTGSATAITGGAGDEFRAILTAAVWRDSDDVPVTVQTEALVGAVWRTVTTERVTIR